MALIGKLRTIEDGWLAFMCPACKGFHHVRVSGGDNPQRNWGWNGSHDAPTFTPSVLTRTHRWEPPVTSENMDEWKRAPWPQTKVVDVCHSFVTDGRIQFLGDCTHELAGQTVDLPVPPE